MELSYDEQERYLLRIFTGQELIYFSSKKLYLVFKQPLNEIKLRANLVYDSTYKQAVEEGLMPIKEIENLLVERKIFTEQDEQKISRLRDKLEAQEIVLAKTTKLKARADRIKEIIKDLKKQIVEIQYKKDSRLMLSAETKADEEKHAFLCSECVRDMEGNKLWGNPDDLITEEDVAFKMEVTTKYLNFYNGLPVNIIRFLARSNLWRIRYVNSQKTSEALFGIPSSEYNNDQLNLVYWSTYYSNIYEMMPEDRPSDEVIDDDELLDAYMNDYYKEKSKELSFRRGDKKHKGKLSSFDKEEVIVTQSNELYQDIEYDKPREAQRVKNRTDLKKRALSRSRR